MNNITATKTIKRKVYPDKRKNQWGATDSYGYYFIYRDRKVYLIDAADTNKQYGAPPQGSATLPLLRKRNGSPYTEFAEGSTKIVVELEHPAIRTRKSFFDIFTNNKQ